jgi:hypothetical protein
LVPVRASMIRVCDGIGTLLGKFEGIRVVAASE